MGYGLILSSCTGVEIVMDGVNSVVGHDVESYSIVVGNPDREIRKRFDDSLIELLLEFKWWNKSIDDINRLIPVLTSSNLEFVKKMIVSILKN